MTDARARRQAAARELAKGLAEEVYVRRAELAALERSLEAMKRAAQGDGPGVACACEAADCRGSVSARRCATCGVVVARCEGHGGSAGATHWLKVHECTAQAEGDE